MVFWNVWGLNKLTKHYVVKSWVQSNGFQFSCILETIVKEGKANMIGGLIFTGWSK